MWSYPTSFPLISSNVSNHHKLVVHHMSIHFPLSSQQKTHQQRGRSKKSPQKNKIQVKEHSIKTTKNRQEILPKVYWSIYKIHHTDLALPIAYYHFHFDHLIEVPANHHVVDPALLRTLQCHPEVSKRFNRPTVTAERVVFQSFSNPQQRKLHPCLKHLRICYVNSLLYSWLKGWYSISQFFVDHHKNHGSNSATCDKYISCLRLLSLIAWRDKANCMLLCLSQKI